MSLFLGPIHHIMYGKIRFQDGLCDYIIDEISKKGHPDYRGAIDAVVAPLVKGDLEDVIETSNIHGSLQAMVSTVEARLALIVSDSIENEYMSLDEIKGIAKNYGRENAFDKGIKLEEAYPAIGARILNGMPCDRVEEVISNEADAFKWRDRVDIHADYWNNFGRDSKDFYEIRSAVIDGLFEATNIEYIVNVPNEFELRRK